MPEDNVFCIYGAEKVKKGMATCMETHMALQKLTMTKVMMVSHCSFVKAAMMAQKPV